MPAHTLDKETVGYVGYMFAPGYAKMLAKKSWFANACEQGMQCPKCPAWLAEYLTPEGFDCRKIRTMLKNPDLHIKVCRLVHYFNDHLGMTMEHATDAEWGAPPNEECDFETSAKMIGIVVDGNIVDQILLPRNPAPFVSAVNRVMELSLYDELDHHWCP